MFKLIMIGIALCALFNSFLIAVACASTSSRAKEIVRSIDGLAQTLIDVSIEH